MPKYKKYNSLGTFNTGTCGRDSNTNQYDVYDSQDPPNNKDKIKLYSDTSYYLPDLINVRVMYLYPTYMAGPTLSTGHADKQGRLGILEPTPNAKHWSSDSLALPSFRWPPRHQRDNFA